MIKTCGNCRYEGRTHPCNNCLSNALLTSAGSGPTEWSSEESDPTGKQPSDPGAKLDEGKPEVFLLDDFSRAMLEVAKVATYGAAKYSRRGWMQVEDGYERYKSAAGRHRLDRAIHGDVDQATGLMHEAQEIWNLLAALEFKLKVDK